MSNYAQLSPKARQRHIDYQRNRYHNDPEYRARKLARDRRRYHSARYAATRAAPAGRGGRARLDAGYERHERLMSLTRAMEVPLAGAIILQAVEDLVSEPKTSPDYISAHRFLFGFGRPDQHALCDRCEYPADTPWFARECRVPGQMLLWLGDGNDADARAHLAHAIYAEYDWDEWRDTLFVGNGIAYRREQMSQLVSGTERLGPDREKSACA